MTRYPNAAARELDLIPTPRDPKNLFGVALGREERAMLAALRH
ncbi:hypothetical protein [Burkholderia ubonensis]|nr:hypothetical protein [Burkholderia ubonensis]